MPHKEYKKKISRTLKYSEAFDNTGKFVGGGILNYTPNIESETWVDVKEDPVLNGTTNEWGVTGRLQIHIAGSRRAYDELGVLLLALANYYPPDPGFSLSIELSDRENKPSIHFVIHLPADGINQKPEYSQICNVATGFIDNKGNITDTTLSAKTE